MFALKDHWIWYVAVIGFSDLYKFWHVSLKSVSYFALTWTQLPMFYNLNCGRSESFSLFKMLFLFSWLHCREVFGLILVIKTAFLFSISPTYCLPSQKSSEFNQLCRISLIWLTWPVQFWSNKLFWSTWFDKLNLINNQNDQISLTTHFINKTFHFFFFWLSWSD